MRLEPFWQRCSLLLLTLTVTGCDQLGNANKAPEPDGAPTEQQLRKISYLPTANSGPNGRKVYERMEEAKSCGDFELATRWNRPPNVEGGLFHQKMVYLAAGLPADLPKNSEVFITAKIESGDTLSSGGEAWFLRLPDGTLIQAIEMANFWEQQAVAAQDSKATAIVKPGKAGRAFCGHGVYQGVVGKHPTEDKKVPLVSVMYAMDRAK
jgi:hypothetical protein